MNLKSSPVKMVVNLPRLQVVNLIGTCRLHYKSVNPVTCNPNSITFKQFQYSNIV